MPTYKITASDGRTLKITGDKPPSEQELNDIFSTVSQQQQTQQTTQQPEQQQQQQQIPPQKQGIIAGAGERIKKRAQRYMAPTMTGGLVRGVLGESAPAKVAAYAAEQPERIWRGATGIAGTALEPVNTLVGGVLGKSAEGWNQLLGRLPEKGIQKIMKSPKMQQGLGELAQKYSNLPESVRANIETLPDALDAVGTVTGGGLVAKTIKGEITKQTIKKLPQKIKDATIKGLSKGVKPTNVGGKSVSKIDDWFKKGQQAVDDIVENKGKLNIINMAGDKVDLPTNNYEFAQAIDQTKDIIFKQYDEMANVAGNRGAQFKADDVLLEIDKITRDKNIPLDGRKYAYKILEDIDDIENASPSVIQSRIKYYNSSLRPFYENKTDKVKAVIDAKIADVLRKNLDDMVTESAGPGYKNLKQKYSALKAIENQVNHRAKVIARQAPKGFFDVTDVFTTPEMIAGIATMNPAMITKGAGGRAMKELIKYFNDPDRAIKKMFTTVSKGKEVLRNAEIPIKNLSDLVKSSDERGLKSIEEAFNTQANKYKKKNENLKNIYDVKSNPITKSELDEFVNQPTRKKGKK